MDIFLQNMIFFLNNLGIIDFVKTTKKEQIQTQDETIFCIILANSELQSKLVIESENI